MYAFRGFIVWYHVNPIYQLQGWYRVIGQDKIGPVPIPVIILLAVTALASLVLNRTRFGRYVYAIGGNEDAARASGINVKLVKLGVYTISGFFCGLAGLVFTSRLGAAQSISGMGFELVAIASVVVGGASLFGGRGSVGNTLVGALIMQVVQSGLVMLDVPSPIQQTILGFIIIIAVGVDMYVQNCRAGGSLADSISGFPFRSVGSERGRTVMKALKSIGLALAAASLDLQRRERRNFAFEVDGLRRQRRRQQGWMVAKSVQSLQAVDDRRLLHGYVDLIHRRVAEGGSGQGQGQWESRSSRSTPRTTPTSSWPTSKACCSSTSISCCSKVRA